MRKTVLGVEREGASSPVDVWIVLPEPAAREDKVFVNIGDIRQGLVKMVTNAGSNKGHVCKLLADLAIGKLKVYRFRESERREKVLVFLRKEFL